MLFDFDDSCDVAHAAFQAMHDGVEARIVGGNCNWTPKAIQGTAPPTDGDSFFYGDSWGVRPALLGDDGCYCASLLYSPETITCHHRGSCSAALFCVSVCCGTRHAGHPDMRITLRKDLS